MSTTTATAVTVDDLEAMPDRDNYELIDGELVERTMNLVSNFVAGKIYRKFDEYFDGNPIGIAFTDGGGFTLRSPDHDQLRKPDAAVVMKSRFPGGRVPNSSFDGAPDIAVVVASPNDVYSKVDSKIQDYLAAGSQLVWLANPARRRIVAFRQDGTEIYHGPKEVITADPVLPGFRMTVGDVFPAV